MSKKYLAGYLDFGVLGRKEAYLFKNEKKEKETQPAFRLVIKEENGWKEVGAFWIKERKEESKKDDLIEA